MRHNGKMDLETLHLQCWKNRPGCFMMYLEQDALSWPERFLAHPSTG
jgi:hypothetical protein